METYYNKLILTVKEGENEIDLTPVKELENRLEKALKGRETWRDRSHVPIISDIKMESEKLNEDQQKYFTNYLLNKVKEYYDLFLSAIENLDEIAEYKKLRDEAKSQFL
ncbi:hypothetical protein KAR52_01410 [Candidatus Pacearchaeota archaeon]|nr:hypothetical protein [Candidatus Pacearchaeota archaeon]